MVPYNQGKMPFPFQYAQPRMWNKPGVHVCSGDRNLIIEVSVPNHRRRHDASRLKTPRACVQARVGHGAFNALPQCFPETVEDGNAETSRQHGPVSLRQAAETQQHPQQLG